MTDDELAAIEARVRAATDGPWTDELAPSVGGGFDIIARGARDRIGRVYTMEADAAFIASARQDVPRLVAEVRRLNALCERLERAIVRMGSGR